MSTNAHAEIHPEPAAADSELVDPDPFTIGLGLFGAVAGGGAFLEARRQRQFMERTQREAFRAAVFAAGRSLIHFRQLIDEFENYMLEDGYGEFVFRIGAVRLAVDRGRHQAMKRMKGQAFTTANLLTDHLDELSEYLGADYQTEVGEVLDELGTVTLPGTYLELISTARRALTMYETLLENVRGRERFETQAQA